MTAKEAIVELREFPKDAQVMFNLTRNGDTMFYFVDIFRISEIELDNGKIIALLETDVKDVVVSAEINQN